jgi:hypothetical protein
MTKNNGLPEFITREEAAAVQRLGRRQLDRLARAGKFKKIRTGGMRTVIQREEERYLAEARGDERPVKRMTLVSHPQACTIQLPTDVEQKLVYAVAVLLTRHLTKILPGCAIGADEKEINIMVLQESGYKAEDVIREWDELQKTFKSVGAPALAITAKRLSGRTLLPRSC